MTSLTKRFHRSCLVCKCAFDTNFERQVTCCESCRETRHIQRLRDTRRRQAAKKSYPHWSSSADLQIRQICQSIFNQLPSTRAALELAMLRTGFSVNEYTLGNMLMRMRDCGTVSYDKSSKIWKKMP